MKVKISNGEVEIKDYCPRKVKKDINKTLFKGVVADTEGKIGGLSPENFDTANETALLGLIEKIIIDGNEKPVTVETLDELDTKDFDLLVGKINKLTTQTIPKG